LKHSISYGDLGLLSVTTDLKLVGCVIDNFLRILGVIFTIKFYDVKSCRFVTKTKNYGKGSYWYMPYLPKKRRINLWHND